MQPAGGAPAASSAQGSAQAVSAGPPPAREYHCACAYHGGRRLVVFGGRVPPAVALLEAAPTLPARFFYHDRFRLQRQAHPNTGYYNDTWSWDTETSTWRQLATHQRWEQLPPPRCFNGENTGGVVIHDRYLVIYGGLQEPGFRDNDTWVLDLQAEPGTWAQVQPSRVHCPLRPTARFHHTLTAVGSSLVVFGGHDKTLTHLASTGVLTLPPPSPEPCPLGALRWKVEAEYSFVELLLGQHRAVPAPRAYHSATAWGDTRLVLFGGSFDFPLMSRLLGDVWILHVSTAVPLVAADAPDEEAPGDVGEWQAVEEAQSPGPELPRQHHASAVSDAGVLVVYAGAHADPDDDDDADEQRQREALEDRLVPSSHVWTLDLHQAAVLRRPTAWRRIRVGPHGAAPPAALNPHCAVLLSAFLVTFGGHLGRELNEFGDRGHQHALPHARLVHLAHALAPRPAHPARAGEGDIEMVGASQAGSEGGASSSEEEEEGGAGPGARYHPARRLGDVEGGGGEVGAAAEAGGGRGGLLRACADTARGRVQAQEQPGRGRQDSGEILHQGCSFTVMGGGTGVLVCVAVLEEAPAWPPAEEAAAAAQGTASDQAAADGPAGGAAGVAAAGGSQSSVDGGGESGFEEAAGGGDEGALQEGGRAHSAASAAPQHEMTEAGDANVHADVDDHGVGDAPNPEDAAEDVDIDGDGADAHGDGPVCEVLDHGDDDRDVNVHIDDSDTSIDNAQTEEEDAEEDSDDGSDDSASIADDASEPGILTPQRLSSGPGRMHIISLSLI